MISLALVNILCCNLDFTIKLPFCDSQVADAVIGNVQEKTIKQYNASNSEVRGGKVETL